MNREQAREILSAFRPGTADERDPIFKEALELARTDAELGAWFAEARAFDRSVHAELGRIAAPTDLRETILASRRIVQPAPWWNPRLNSRHWAAAAAIALLAAGLAFWFGSTRAVSFQEFQREIADQSWGTAPHVEQKVGSIQEVRQSLQTRGVDANFALPPTLEKSVHGYSLMHWRGHEVPMICLQSESQHLHLLVVDRHVFPDAPVNNPLMDQWQALRTASWSYDQFSYVLTGLNTPTFVKKFRKSKRWDWEG